MSFYLLINIAIISIPLLLSFERRVMFYRKWPYVFRAIVVIGFFYVAWDVLATATGHWWFNPRYVSSIKLFFLPPEEILFFVTTPFSCLFIYEVVCFFHSDKSLRFSRMLGYALSLLGLILGVIFIERHYTALSFFSAALFFYVATRYFYVTLATQNFWIYLLICYVPFAIFNGILTGVPVVEYAADAILGWRIGTIPLEDFIYNFSYLSFTLIAYRYYRSQKI